MNQKLFFLHRDETRANHAGSKAVRDAEDIFLSMGMAPVPVYSAGDAEGLARKLVHGSQLARLMTLPAGSVLFIQYPMYRMKRDYVALLRRVGKMRKIRLVFLIHDLEIIRHAFPDNPDLTQRDAEMLAAADKIIVHNHKMADYLIRTCKADPDKMIPLGLFDYLTPGECPVRSDPGPGPFSVCVAGNLDPNKSGYLRGLSGILPGEIALDLYGVNYSGEFSRANVTYHGSFDADILPDLLTSSFGLVWDGPETQSCAGNMGNYMKYNNPHKVSLYIAAGIPVIIWEKAALAGYVTEHKIGFTVASLDEIPGRILGLSKEEYREYIVNLMPLRRKVRDGAFLKEAIKSACQPVN